MSFVEKQLKEWAANPKMPELEEIQARYDEIFGEMTEPEDEEARSKLALKKLRVDLMAMTRSNVASLVMIGKGRVNDENENRFRRADTIWREGEALRLANMPGSTPEDNPNFEHMIMWASGKPANIVIRYDSKRDPPYAVIDMQPHFGTRRNERFGKPIEKNPRTPHIGVGKMRDHESMKLVIVNSDANAEIDGWKFFRSTKMAVGYWKDRRTHYRGFAVRDTRPLGGQDVPMEQVSDFLLNSDDPFLAELQTNFADIPDYVEKKPYTWAIVVMELLSEPTVRNDDVGYAQFGDPQDFSVEGSTVMHVNMHKDLAEHIAENYDLNTVGVALVEPSVYERTDLETQQPSGEIGMSGNLFAFVPIPTE